MKFNLVKIGTLIILSLLSVGPDAIAENSIIWSAPDSALEGNLSFIADEAGITAYGEVTSVNLGLAENAFKNVEIKTNDYIIGSVALPDYGETDDVHVYLNTSGWIVAYYFKEEKASKIIDWLDYGGGEITNTKLRDAIELVCIEMYVGYPTIAYYDFRFPNATNIMFIVDEETVSQATEKFKVKIPPPPDYILQDRSFSHAMNRVGTYDGCSGTLYIDGVQINTGSITSGLWAIWDGNITAQQLFPGEFHEVSIYHWARLPCTSYGAIVLIYTKLN